MDPKHGRTRTSHIIQNEDAGTVLLKYKSATVLIFKFYQIVNSPCVHETIRSLRVLFLNLLQPQSPGQSLHDRRAPLHRPHLRTTRVDHPIRRGVRTYPLHRNVPSHGTRWITSTQCLLQPHTHCGLRRQSLQRHRLAGRISHRPRTPYQTRAQRTHLALLHHRRTSSRGRSGRFAGSGNVRLLGDKSTVDAG